jgi:hypothetical protein
VLKKANGYSNIKGSPYYNEEFMEAEIYLKDQTAYKLPVRYNIFSNSMEYNINDIIYEIGNPTAIDHLILDNKVFFYLNTPGHKGYYECLVKGKVFLMQQRIVKFIEAEPPKPYSEPKPAEFETSNDRFFIFRDLNLIEIKSKKSILEIFNDQRTEIETFIKKEKINNFKKENLIKLVEYYNSL